MDESQSRVPKRLLRILLAGGILAGAWMLADAVFSTHSASAAGIDEIVPAVTETVTTPVISTVVEVTEPAIAPIVAATSTPVTAVIAAVSPVVTPLVAPLATTIELLPLPAALPATTQPSAGLPAPEALPAQLPIRTPASVPSTPAAAATAAFFPIADLGDGGAVTLVNEASPSVANDDLPSFPFFESDTTPD